MKCPACNGATYVIDTRQQVGGVRRQRRCKNCQQTHYSGEVWLATLSQAQKGAYTHEEAAAIKRQRVDARRKNEDRRDDDAS